MFGWDNFRRNLTSSSSSLIRSKKRAYPCINYKFKWHPFLAMKHIDFMSNSDKLLTVPIQNTRGAQKTGALQ